MASRNSRSQLGDSWVVDEDDDSLEYSPQQEDFDIEEPAAFTPPRRSPRNERSPPPELVMPSLLIEAMNSSVGGPSGRSPRDKGRRRAERQEEPRRRITRSGMSNGSPQKPPRPKTAEGGTIFRSSQESTTQRDQDRPQSILDLVVEHIAAMASFLVEIITGALGVLKKPLSYLLAIWMLFGVLIIGRNFVTNSVYASLSPICRVPGASLLGLPFCPIYNVDTTHGTPPPVEFNELMTVQAKFEEVLEESAGGVSLPLDMKRGEASIRDLRQLVRYSHLHSK